MWSHGQLGLEKHRTHLVTVGAINDFVSNDAANRNLARVVVVPLTSNTGRQYPGEAVVSVDGQSSKAMADQIMAADKARLKSQLGTVNRADMQAVEDAIRIQLGLAK